MRSADQLGSKRVNRLAGAQGTVLSGIGEQADVELLSTQVESGVQHVSWASSVVALARRRSPTAVRVPIGQRRDRAGDAELAVPGPRLPLPRMNAEVLAPDV